MKKQLQAEQGVIAIPDADQHLAGSMVFWSLSGKVDIAKLLEEWRARDLDESWLPELPTPEKAIRRAVKAQRAPRRLIRPLGRRSGWCIVDEEVVDGGDDLAHTTELRVKLNAIRQVECLPEEGRMQDEIRARYWTVLNELSSSDVSSWLIRMVHKVMAVNLRPKTGGFYFVPQEKVELWKTIASALEASSACEVQGIPAMRAADAVRAVLSGINAETRGIVERMNEDIPKLGKRGLENRLEECEDVETKVKFYEGFLGQTLTDLRDSLKRLKASIAAGIQVADGDEDDDGPESLALAVSP